MRLWLGRSLLEFERLLRDDVKRRQAQAGPRPSELTGKVFVVYCLLLPLTTCSRMKLVEPLAICVPATTPSTSPAFSLPDLSNSCSAVLSISSAPKTWSRRTGCTPQSRFMRLHTAGTWLKAKIRDLGLNFESVRAVLPVSVNTAIAAMSRSSAACATDSQIVSEMDSPRCSLPRRRCKNSSLLLFSSLQLF